MATLAEAAFMLGLLFSPLLAYVAGFYAGRLGHKAARLGAVILVMVLPPVLLAWPLLVPGSSDSDRYGAAMGLVVLGLPLALWILFSAAGAFAGAKPKQRPG